jgi:ectoine hydroxylase-related dioxygenase (phytanoyl-CoA dioxygenase family)
MSATSSLSEQSESEIAEIVRTYRRDGFVAVRALIPRAEIEALKTSVDEAVAIRVCNDDRPFEARTPYEQAFRQCISLWEDFPSVRPLTFHPTIIALSARFLATDRVRLWHDQALYKEPGGRETEAHQDFAYWPVAEPDMITAWIPLVDVTEETGCMGYVPGTQTAPREFIDIFRKPGDGQAYAARHNPAVFVPAQVGDVIFHHACTVDMAKPNRGRGIRAAHTVVYFRDGCTFNAYGRDHPTDRNGNKQGEPIRGPATPLVWPFPEKYPDPAPWPDEASVPEHYLKIGVVPRRRPTP